MKFSDIRFQDYPRAELRKALRNNGVPDHAVEETVDLACRAAEKARLAVLETTELASQSNIALCAFGIAFSLVASDAQAMMNAQKEFGRQNGAKMFEGTLTDLAR